MRRLEIASTPPCPPPRCAPLVDPRPRYSRNILRCTPPLGLSSRLFPVVQIDELKGLRRNMLVGITTDMQKHVTDVRKEIKHRL